MNSFGTLPCGHRNAVTGGMVPQAFFDFEANPETRLSQVCLPNQSGLMLSVMRLAPHNSEMEITDCA
jgi:hypothetical protein